MMPWILINAALFDGNTPASRKALNQFLGALASLSADYRLRNPDAPMLYDAGVRYDVPEQISDRRLSEGAVRDIERFAAKRGATSEQVDVIGHFFRGIEIFRDTPSLYRKGGADCDVLTVTRVGEIWAAGQKHGVPIDATPYLTWRDEGNRTIYHATVGWPAVFGLPFESTEDPSLILGMGGADRAKDRLAAIAENVERYETVVTHLLANGVDPASAKAFADDLGLLPKSGVFRVPNEGRVA